MQSMFSQSYCTRLKTFKKLVRYLKGTQHKTLKLMMSNKVDRNRQGQLILRQFADSDWAGCKKTRKSTSCKMIFLSDFLLIHACHRQATIAQSSGEAEYISMCSASSDALYCKNLFSFVSIEKEVILASDSNAARSLALRQGVSKKMRHMDVKHLVLQQLTKRRLLRVVIVPGNKNPTDLSTKYHPVTHLHELLKQVGVVADPNEFEGPDHRVDPPRLPRKRTEIV